MVLYFIDRRLSYFFGLPLLKSSHIGFIVSVKDGRLEDRTEGGSGRAGPTLNGHRDRFLVSFRFTRPLNVWETSPPQPLAQRRVWGHVPRRKPRQRIYQQLPVVYWAKNEERLPRLLCFLSVRCLETSFLPPATAIRGQEDSEGKAAVRHQRQRRFRADVRRRRRTQEVLLQPCS